MSQFTSQAIRDAFIRFFEQKGHTQVPSSSLVPGNDPTLLFTNSGMVQFKEVFLGLEQRPYTTACSIQRCVRAGGKHNDLDNVGYTARHHTFFEMLGNFSFGQYFKREAIQFAWEFLTQVLKMPANKLWITIHESDAEAEQIWLKEIGVDPARFTKINTSDNFWSMGDTGPCGPCTEIFYDHGPEIAGGPPGSPDADGDRYIEIWNLVFMQYNRDAAGVLHPLPKPSVDTGMGLERLAAVLQGVHDNYEIDTFVQLIASIQSIAPLAEQHPKSLRVIADHIRSTSFLVLDGVQPSNEGRGYVLRRIIRRAIRHGHQLGIRQAFFGNLVHRLAAVMGQAYPELVEKAAHIQAVLLKEEAQFERTLDLGLSILKQELPACRNTGKISGELAFKLYDTYGFPLDLTEDIAREEGLAVDRAGFEVCMQQQRERAKQAAKFAVEYQVPISDCQSHFVGYDQLFESTEILALLKEGQVVNSLSAGELGAVILAVSPFYAESGGQVGDVGTIVGANGVFEVLDTQKQGQAIVHVGRMQEGYLSQDALVEGHVDVSARQATAQNHSATHLLHATLKLILGAHAEQRGSLVNPERLRFDFAHTAPITSDEIERIEQRVNQEIYANHTVEVMVTSLEKAKKMGAVALFGEKYGAEVRVLKMGEFSTEFCGGTHIRRTGDIGLFKIVSTGSVAAGIRRIEAVTGQAAVNYIQTTERLLNQALQVFAANRDDLSDKLRQSQQKSKDLQNALEACQLKLLQADTRDLGAQAVLLKGVWTLVAEVPNASPKALRQVYESLKSELKPSAICLLSSFEGKVGIFAAVSEEAQGELSAADWIGAVAPIVGGKGGGRRDSAQAGGSLCDQLPAALTAAQAYLTSRLS